MTVPIKDESFSGQAALDFVPQANAYCERVIESLRRGCLDHVIVLDDLHAERICANISGTTTGGPIAGCGCRLQSGADGYRLPGRYWRGLCGARLCSAAFITSTPSRLERASVPVTSLLSVTVHRSHLARCARRSIRGRQVSPRSRGDCGRLAITVSRTKAPLFTYRCLGLLVGWSFYGGQVSLSCSLMARILGPQEIGMPR